MDLVERLRKIIHSVLETYITDKHYALLDFPNHSNVGDSAIWAGERAYFKQYWGRDPSYVCEHDLDCQTLADAIGDGPILLHGGGNFGDVWPYMHQFRETVLDRFRGHTMIQLPQSIQFEDATSLRRTAELIARHGAFVLLVRDQSSYELAISNFDCAVRLCPDMAFCLGAMSRSRHVAADQLAVALLRTDREAVSSYPGPAPNRRVIVSDWMKEPMDTASRARFRSRIGTLTSLDPRQFALMARRIRYYDELAAMRIRRGIDLLSRGRQLISDRLHVHILGTLLDIPQIMLDNNYGKINRFMETWNTDWIGVRRALDLDTALNLVAS
jgi:exopolysaccharide biosynthesis predicted pyruvyltransferase EpsI